MVRLVCYNIEYCQGMQGHWYEYMQFWRIFSPPAKLDQKIITSLKKVKPDVLALVEVDSGSIRAKDEISFLKKKLAFTHSAQHVKYPRTGWLSFFHQMPILKKQSNAILTKYSLSNIQYHMLKHGTKRLVIQATINCPTKVTLFLAHLALGKKTRQKQLNELCHLVKKSKTPIMLMGDFNTYGGISELTHLLASTKLQDTHQLNKKSATFPSWQPVHRLDYILTSPEIKVKNYTVLNYPFSDHLPVMIDFSVSKR